MVIDGMPIGTYGPLAFVVVVMFLGLMRGWVVVKASYDEKCRESERWQHAWKDEHAAHLLTIQQNGELLEVGRLQRARLEAAEQINPPESKP